MTDELKAFRVLLVPLFLIIVFFIGPKMCSKKPVTPTPAETATVATTQTTASGLQIVGSPPQSTGAKESTYPEGLDAARIQYLVEIDSQFSEPATAFLAKKFAADEITALLARKKYIERAPDGTTIVTRDGALALDLRERSDGWTLTTAKRAFDKVTYVSRVDDEKYDASFTWHWEPTPIGTELKIEPKKVHSATARFAGGERHWALTEWVAAPNDAK